MSQFWIVTLLRISSGTLDGDSTTIQEGGAGTMSLLRANEKFLVLLDHPHWWPLGHFKRSKAFAYAYREKADLRSVYIVSLVGRLLVRCVFIV